MRDEEEKIPVINEHGKEEKGPSPDDFDFSDIPILGQDKSQKRDSFSFESFDKGAKPKISIAPIAAFTKSLEAHEEDEEPPLDATRELTPEALEQQRQKWEKKAKDASSRISPWKIIVPAALLLFFVLAVCIPLILFSKKEEPPPPPKPLPKPAKPVAPQPQPNLAQPAQPPPQQHGNPEQPAEQPDKPETPVEPVKVEPPKPPPEPAISEEAQEELDSLKSLFSKDSAPSDEKLASAISGLLTRYKNERLMHEELIDFLKSKDKMPVAKECYGSWVIENSGSFIPNYIYGTLICEGYGAIPYLSRACSLSPRDVEPFIAMANIFERAREWRKASDTYASCLLSNPDNLEIRKRYTIAKIHSDNPNQAIADFQEFLKSRGLPEQDVALESIELAQMLQGPSMSERLIEQIAADPKMSDKAKLYSMRHRMLYGGNINASEFQGFLSKDMRALYMLYLLSHGKNSKAMMVPTPPSEFPDFWKVFLTWRAGDPVWKSNAQRLLERTAYDKDRTIHIISSVWLDTIKPDDARGMISEVPPDSEPLFYFALAEIYKKVNNPIAVKVLYAKARKSTPSIYMGIIEYYSSK